MKNKLLKISILLLSVIMLCNICFAEVDRTKPVISSNPNSNPNTHISSKPMADIEKEVFGTTQEELDRFYGDDPNKIDVKEGDVYLIEETVDFKGQYIDGNVYLMGEKVNVDAEIIDGNLFVMAQDTEINSEVRGSIYVLCGNAKISSRAKDVYVACEKVELTKDSYIIRDARLCASEVKLNGRVNNNAYSAAANTIIDDETSNARIVGQLHYTGELNKTDSAYIGEIIKDEPLIDSEEIEKEANSAMEAAGSAIDTFGIAMGLSCGIAVIIIAGLLFKNPKANIIPEGKNPIAVTFVDAIKGLGLMIVIPIGLVVLLITIIGLPVSLVGLMVYILLILASIPVASLVIVRTFLSNKVNGNGLQILVAILVYIGLTVINIIPVVGPIINTLVMWYGFFKILTVGQRYSKVSTEVVKDPVVIEK